MAPPRSSQARHLPTQRRWGWGILSRGRKGVRTLVQGAEMGLDNSSKTKAKLKDKCKEY